MSLVRIQSPRPPFANAGHSSFATDGKPPNGMISVPIQYRRTAKAQFIQKLQHAVPSFVVFGDGVEHLSHREDALDLVLGSTEVVVSVLVVGSVFRGLRALRAHMARTDHVHQHAHHGVDWIDICIGIMLMVEAWSKYHASGHIARPTLLLALVMIALGVTHGRLLAFGARRRELRIDGDGISVATKPFNRMSLKWPEVASIEIGDRWAVISATNGRSRRIDLSDVMRPQAVRDALMQARTLLDDAHHAASASIESTSSAT